jgi:hypothetical protein
MKTKKCQKLGDGFIWFSGNAWDGKRLGYTEVLLTRERNGRGGKKALRIGKLGGWVRVKLYAEYVD